MELDDRQRASQEQFARRSECYGRGHILADTSDVERALEGIELPEGAEALDVACGAGHTGLYLAGLGHRVTCADIAAPMLTRVEEFAGERGLEVATRQHAAEEFPDEDGSFDLVTCRVAAHHFSDVGAFVREAARVLRPGGWLLVIDGSIEDGEAVASSWTHAVEKLRDPSHGRFIAPGEWRKLCSESGLSVEICSLAPMKMPSLEWYFDTADTPEENRRKVLDLVEGAPEEAKALFRIGEEEGQIVWWWRRMTLVARPRLDSPQADTSNPERSEGNPRIPRA